MSEIVWWILVVVMGGFGSPKSSLVRSLEVDASLSGYNLLWPSQRCCSFELKVAPSGRATLRVDISSGSRPIERKEVFRLTTLQMKRLENAIAEARFFELPAVVGTTALDGDIRKVQIRRGNQTHQVEIGESVGTGSVATAELSRAESVWRAIRDLLKIPESSIE